jgi:dihydroorotate dehydrogenase electron transfer subunit
MKIHPKEVKAKILFHRRIAADYFCLRLLCPDIARFAEPGQFILLRVNELRDPFLRRPFSFSRILPPKGKRTRPEDEGALEICYKIVGRGTSLMTQLREGQRLDLLGPLGKGFWKIEGQERAILVGGGIGVAPLLPWAERLQGERRKKKAPKSLEENPEVLVLIGGKSRDKILGMLEFKKIGCEPQVATEDGSLGMQGMATDLLERELMTQGSKSASLYACGPMPMLAKVAQIADQFDLPCQVLMEARMACGVGACLGCAVKVKEEASGRTPESEDPTAARERTVPAGECGEGEMGSAKERLVPVITEVAAFRYARACKEGPVFEAKEILWE